MSALYILMFFALAVAIGFMVYIQKTFKHTLIVKRLAGRGKLVSNYKMRIFDNPDGSKDFYLMGNRKLPRPPEEALNLNANGGYVLEAYYDGNQYHWIVDTTTTAEMPEVRPFTQDQRTFMVLENQKADRDEGSSWTKYLPQIASGLVIIIVLFGSYMVYENFNETMIELNAQNVQISNNNVEISRIMSRVDERLQTIESRVDTGIPD